MASAFPCANPRDLSRLAPYLPNNSVRVVNSIGVTITRTSPKRAKALVSRGIAGARGNAVEMIEDDHRVSPQGCKPRHFRDGDGFATLDGIRGLPVAGDVTRLIAGKRPATPPRDFQNVEISRTPLPMELW